MDVHWCSTIAASSGVIGFVSLAVLEFMEAKCYEVWALAGATPKLPAATSRAIKHTPPNGINCSGLQLNFKLQFYNRNKSRYYLLTSSV